MTLPNGVVLTYGYDNDSRLTGMSYALGATPIGNLTYGYDAAGLRTQAGGGLARTGFPAAVLAVAPAFGRRSGSRFAIGLDPGFSRLEETPPTRRFWEGHDFSRAVKGQTEAASKR